MKNKYLGFLLAGLFSFMLVLPALSFVPTAQAQDSGSVLDDDTTTDSADIDRYFNIGDPVGGQTAGEFATNANLQQGNLTATLSKIIKIVIGFLGVLAVLIVLAGGFKWMTSQGETTKVDEARKLLIAGLVGLVIVLAAYAIATFVIRAIVSATA